MTGAAGEDTEMPDGGAEGKDVPGVEDEGEAAGDPVGEELQRNVEESLPNAFEGLMPFSIRIRQK